MSFDVESSAEGGSLSQDGWVARRLEANAMVCEEGARGRRRDLEVVDGGPGMRRRVEDTGDERKGKKETSHTCGNERH